MSVSPPILVVEDDPLGLNFFRSSLSLSGYNVTTAQSANEAQSILEREGTSAFAAVLTDFRMPGRTGLDLLEWIRQRDQALATVIVTAQGERELVKRSLTAGAAGFLDKPVKHQQLSMAVAQAIEQTERQRRYAQDQAGLAAAARLDSAFTVQPPASMQPHLTVRYEPLHQIGGDFVFAREMGAGRYLLAAGDVSGHDIPSGLASAYFQGMLQGLTAKDVSPWEVLPLIHRHLLDRATPSSAEEDLPISLAVGMVEIETESSTLNVFSAGFPHLIVVDQAGFCESVDPQCGPLGWDMPVDFRPRTLESEGTSSLYLFSDGALEMADEVGVSPLAILYRLIHKGEEESDFSLQTQDDVLIVRYQMKTNEALTFQPLLDEHYSGDEVDAIDDLQNLWRRSIQFAVGDALGDRLFDLLICLREGMLNALIHGCGRESAKVARLQMSYDRTSSLIRVRIDDPGKGHSFDLKARLAELPDREGRNLGLGIIQHLADDFGVRNEGTSLIFDFKITPEAPEHG